MAGGKGNGSRNSPPAPLPRRPAFAGPMSPSNGCSPQPASRINPSGLRPPGTGGERNGRVHFSSKLSKNDSVSFAEKISQWRWIKARKLQESVLHALHGTRPEAAAQNRLQCSAAGSTLQCVSSRARPGELGIVQCGFASRARDLGVAGFRHLVLVLNQDAPLRTPNPLLSGHLQPCTSSVPVTQAWKPRYPPSLPPLFPAFQK